ncbi:MAG: hypothetical protein QXF45_00080 [Candidatus Caldarchaeum sp.]
MSKITARETQEFLETLFKNKLTEAERVLEQLQQKHPEDSRYILALRGIMISYVGDDSDSFIYMLFQNKEIWKKRRQLGEKFTELSEKFGAVDRFFVAWADVLDIVGKIQPPAKITSPSTD